MKITFLGTRGCIDARTRRHRMHSSLLVAHRGSRVMVDCGADWLGSLGKVHPDAIVLTHAHPDHVGGLRSGSPCAVYATEECWDAVARLPMATDQRHVLRRRVPQRIGAISFEAFAVVHSLRAPAVGYRIRGGGASAFYVPDVVSIPDRAHVLSRVRLYIGDGATLVRPIVRWRGNTPFGHAPIRLQLEWCRAAAIPRAIFSHCGSQIVAGDERRVAERVRALGRERSVDARLAHDGLQVVLR